MSVKNLVYSVKIHETQCSLCLANIKPCTDLYKFLLGKVGYRKKELKLWKIANKEHIFGALPLCIGELGGSHLAWQHMPLILALGKWRQKNQELMASPAI